MDPTPLYLESTPHQVASPERVLLLQRWFLISYSPAQEMHSPLNLLQRDTRTHPPHLSRINSKTREVLLMTLVDIEKPLRVTSWLK